MISFVNVSKTFKNKNRKVQALNNVSYSFKEKGFYSIVGESGSGKSTFLNLLTLQKLPTKGKVIIDGIDTSKLNDLKLSSIRKEYFSIIFQDFNLIDLFNAHDNLVLPFLMHNQKSDENRIIEALDKVKLDKNILKEDINNLSGGQRQRVAIARALLTECKVLVCDEPTGSIDEDLSNDIFELLKDISKTKLVIVVTHNDELALDYSDYIINIDRGKIDCNEEVNPSSQNKKIKGSKFSLRMLLKCGLNSFRNMFKKSILAFISTFLMVSALLMGITFLMTDNHTIANNLFKDNNVVGIMAEKKNGFFNEDKDSFDDVNYIPIYYLNKKAIYCTNYYDLKEFNLIGETPKDNENYCEVVITKYSAIKDFELLSMEDINDENKVKTLIGKESVVYYYGDINVKIVGILDTKTNFNLIEKNEKNLEWTLDSCVFLSPSYTEKLIDFRKTENYWCDKIFILNPETSYFLKTNDEVRSVFKDNTFYYSPISNDLYTILANLDVIGKISVFISVFFILLSLIIFVDYINFSVDNYFDKIKILISVGVSKVYCSLIFIFQGILISALCFIPAIFIYNFGINFLNRMINNKINLSYNIINTNPLICVGVFFMLVIISSLITHLKFLVKLNSNNEN